jgi:hypothetical protein
VVQDLMYIKTCVLMNHIVSKNCLVWPNWVEYSKVVVVSQNPVKGQPFLSFFFVFLFFEFVEGKKHKT